jgi:spore maturation protein CgeB
MEQTMNILYLSKERDIDLAKKHKIMYLDHTFKNLAGDFPDWLLEQIRKFKPDLVLEREFNDGVSKYPELIEFITKEFPICKKAVWLIDSHCNLEWHQAYAPLFDYAFIAISRYVPIIAGHLKKIGAKTKCFWLPLCYPFPVSKVIRNKGKVPFDIVFVGRWGKWFEERTRLIEMLKEHYGDGFFAITDYSNMETYLRQAIISFNRSIYDDMNFRVFESLANGVELVTNDVQDLHLIGGLAERISIYQDDKDLIDKCDQILEGELEHDVILNQIWISLHHCLIHRHNELLKMMETGEQHQY